MQLVRFKIRNELSLGGPELNRSPAVEYEEPKAILGAVEVAGLVGILRQLGDLAEFSAEVFSGIQEEVTVTASRCQKLTSRVKRIESALSPLEKAVLSQTSHIHFAYTAGCEWHPRIRNGQRHFVQSDLPLCVMETYEQCRDPPPLHLLDRFDAGGPGSCLRKYSDPTFFRKELGDPSKADDIKVQRDQHRKRKKKRLPQRNICRSRAVSTSDETSGAHISYLTDDRPTTSQSTSTVDMPRSSNMQELSDMVDQSHLPEQSDIQEPSEAQIQSDFQESSKPRDSITDSGYIEYVIKKCPVNKPEANLVEGFLSGSLQPADRIGSSVPEGCVEVLDDNILYSPSDDMHVPCASIVCDEKKETLELSDEKSNEEASEIHELKFGPGTPDRVTQNQRDFDRTYDFFDEVDIMGGIQSRSQANSIDRKPRVENEGENKSEQESEADEFVDARNTVESESESELDGVPKPKLEHYFGNISTYCSEDANSDNNDGSDLPYEEMLEDPRHDNSLDESCSGSYLTDDTNVSRCLSDPVCETTMSCDETFQKPREFFAMCPSLLAEEAFLDVAVLPEEPVAAHPLLAGIYANEKISSEEPISSGPSMKDDIPTEKILPEEHLANYPSLAETVSHEKILIGESVAKYPSFAEIVPTKSILPEESLPKIPYLAEAVPDNVTPAEEPDAAHPSFSKAVQENKNLPEVLDSEICSVPEAVSQEQISPKEYVGIYPRLAGALPDERFLAEESEEPATTCLSLTKTMPTEKLLPELEAYDYLAESPKEKILQEKSVDSTHPSCAKAAPEENLSSKVLDSTNLSVAEAVSQEHIGLEEFVGIDPCFAEAVPDERFLPEEPVITCLSLTKSATIEGVLPEKPLETYLSFAKLPEQKILHEEADDATHPSFSEAVSDEQISPEVLDSTNLPVAAAVPQEQIGREEFVGIDPCLANAVPDENVLPEEPVTTCVSLTKAAAIEKTLPVELSETYPSLAELPEKKISHEEADDATHRSSDEKISPEVYGYTNLTLEEDLPQEQISLEEFVGIDPCLEQGVPDERFLPEETVTTCLSLKKAATIEGVLPEKPLESFAEFPVEKLLDEETDDATHPSVSETVSDEQISPEVLDSTNFPVAAVLPQEHILFEESVGSPFLAEVVPDKRVLPEEPVTTCMSLTKPEDIHKVWPDERLEATSSEQSPKDKISQENSDDGTYPSCAKAESDDNVSPVLDSENLTVAEAIPQEKIALEEFVGIHPCFAEAVSDERVLPEEPVTTFMSMTKEVPIEIILPEEPLEVYPSLEEFLEEKMSQEEEPDDDTLPYFSEAVGNEKISPLEHPCCTYPSLEESDAHENTAHEEIVGTTPFLELADPNISSFPDKPGVTYLSSAEAVSKEKNLPEEPLPTYLSLAEAVPEEKIPREEPDAARPLSAEAVFDEKISGSEPVNTAEAAPHNKTFHEEPAATDLSLSEATFDEHNPGLEYPASTTESGPQNKTFPEEPVAMYVPLAEPVPDENILPKEPAYLDLSEGIPDQKVFLDDAAFLSFAEAIFDQKFSPEVPDSTYPSLVKEGEAFDDPYTASDVSMNQNSGFSEPESADRTFPSSGGSVTISPDSQGSMSNCTIVESINIWSNGGLLGLAPSKPPVFAEPNSVSEHIQNEIKEAGTKKQESSSRSVQDNEKSTLPLVVSIPTSQQQSSMLSHSNGALSHLQSTATSFKVFGLSHRLLMAGFRGNSKFESIPTTSYDTKSAAIEDKTQQTPPGSNFEDQLAYEFSLFGSPTSSPPVEHIKISFNPIDTSRVSKLKLRIPCQPQKSGENADMFPSFQLVPEASNSDDDDNNSDIFCQSSPCVSDNCLSDSELWESDESPRESTSNLKQVGERSTHGDMGSFSGSFLDLPCFDSVDHQSTFSRLEQEQVSEYKLSVSEIIRDWPPNQQKSSPGNEANPNVVLDEHKRIGI